MPYPQGAGFAKSPREGQPWGQRQNLHNHKARGRGQTTSGVRESLKAGADVQTTAKDENVAIRRL